MKYTLTFIYFFVFLSKFMMTSFSLYLELCHYVYFFDLILNVLLIYYILLDNIYSMYLYSSNALDLSFIETSGLFLLSGRKTSGKQICCVFTAKCR